MARQFVLNGITHGAPNSTPNGVLNKSAHEFPSEAPPPEISLGSFKWASVDDKFHRLAGHHEAARVLAETPRAAALVSPPPTPPPALGPLSNFVGIFRGVGLNTIWRPTQGIPAPGFPNDGLLELNLTKETLSFSQFLGDVPNRGFGDQKDIHLNGVPYAQAIDDVTNTATGKPDGPATSIHFEPGVWMSVPATTDPSDQASLVRMGSIPHGTTINAQGAAPSGPSSGGPQFSAVSLQPFLINGGAVPAFPQLKVENENAPRLPSDLTLFNTAGTITDLILANPNTVLSNAVAGQNITNTTVFTVSTLPQKVANPLSGGGTANINFLSANTGPDGPNANAASMTATFWIETVQYQLTVPPFPTGQKSILLQPQAPNPNAPLPTFEVHAGSTHITAPVTIPVNATQIQYSQEVLLNFNGLSWPHVSVATLVPLANIPVVLAAQ